MFIVNDNDLDDEDDDSSQGSEQEASTIGNSKLEKDTISRVDDKDSDEDNDKDSDEDNDDTSHVFEQ